MTGDVREGEFFGTNELNRRTLEHGVVLLANEAGKGDYETLRTGEGIVVSRENVPGILNGLVDNIMNVLKR